MKRSILAAVIAAMVAALLLAFGLGSGTASAGIKCARKIAKPSLNWVFQGFMGAAGIVDLQTALADLDALVTEVKNRTEFSTQAEAVALVKCFAEEFLADSDPKVNPLERANVAEWVRTRK